MTHPLRQAAALAAFLISLSSLATAQTFIPVKEPECLRSVAGLFHVGGQYVDPDNGVANGYSMLGRWQGASLMDNYVNYDLSAITGFGFASTVGSVYGTPPTVSPQYQWQRGLQPENSRGTPGVQLYCNGGGMLLNTWEVPHIQIVGGGYNDMFGYQWASGTEPYAFGYTDGYGAFWPAELDVQANLGVAEVYVHRGTSNAQRKDPDGQLALFAYVIDTNRPSLHPIAIVADAYDTSGTGLSSSVAGFVGQDYPGGVYFVSAGFTQNTAYSTADPYSSPSVQLGYTLEQVMHPSTGTPFFRVRLTQPNWANAIHDINRKICGAPDCGTSGYTDPGTYGYQSYRLKYAGVISELVLTDGDYSGSVNDATKDQISMGSNFHDFGVYLRH